MKVKLLSTKDNGNLDRERAILEVLVRTDIGRYIICDTTFYEDGKVSNLLRHVYWFSDKVVEKGDYVVLFTNKGKNVQYRNRSGSTTHKFYWGLDHTVWNNSDDGGVLFFIGDWMSKKMVKEE